MEISVLKIVTISAQCRVGGDNGNIITHCAMMLLCCYTQYGFIRNSLIRNTTKIFRISKEQLLKILEIRKKFFYGKEIKERAMKS